MPRKKEMLSYTLSIPENLDIDIMLATTPPDFEYERDNFVYIASLPYSIMESFRNRDKEYEIALNFGYVPFYSKIIKQKVNNYKPYIQYFMDNGVLECDDKSSKDGGKSFGYRLTLEYTTIHKPVSIERQSLIRQLRNRTHPNIEEDEVLEETPLSAVPYLTKWFNPALRIDMEKVKIFLKNLYQIDKEAKGTDYAKRKEITLWMSAQKIHNNECSHNLNIDRIGRRFYSPLTNLKSELRAYVTYDNKKLVSLDLKSSQPFFSLVLLDTNAFDRYHVGNILSLYSDYLYLEDNNIDLYIEKLRSLIKERQHERDIYEYKMSLNFGYFYEKRGVKMGTYFNQPFGEEITVEGLKEQRDITKIKTLIMTYSKWSNKKYKSHYPNIDEILSLIKKKDHRVLSWVLQYIEADMLLYKICPQIAAKNPNIPLFTIHDSIITTEEHAEYVYEKMIEIIQETIGFTPKIKPEILEEKNTTLLDREEDIDFWEEEGAFEEVKEAIS